MCFVAAAAAVVAAATKRGRAGVGARRGLWGPSESATPDCHNGPCAGPGPRPVRLALILSAKTRHGVEAA